MTIPSLLRSRKHHSSVTDRLMEVTTLTPRLSARPTLLPEVRVSMAEVRASTPEDREVEPEAVREEEQEAGVSLSTVMPEELAADLGPEAAARAPERQSQYGNAGGAGGRSGSRGG